MCFCRLRSQRHQITLAAVVILLPDYPSGTTPRPVLFPLPTREWLEAVSSSTLQYHTLRGVSPSPQAVLLAGATGYVRFVSVCGINTRYRNIQSLAASPPAVPLYSSLFPTDYEPGLAPSITSIPTLLYGLSSIDCTIVISTFPIPTHQTCIAHRMYIVSLPHHLHHGNGKSNSGSRIPHWSCCTLLRI